jgi:hypothetical protein
MRASRLNMVGAFGADEVAGGDSSAWGQAEKMGSADRQIAMPRDRHDAFARLAEDMEFAKGRDVVEAAFPAPRIGDQPVL